MPARPGARRTLSFGAARASPRLLYLCPIAAGPKGSAATIRQYLEGRLIDEPHLAVSPALLGKGENLFAGLDWTALGYEVAEHVAGEAAMHVVIRRRK